MQVQIVVTWKGDLLGRLARRFGLTWTHAALRYMRDEASEARVIEAAACGIRERAWEEFIAGVKEWKGFEVRDGLSEIQMREIVAYAWGNVGKPYCYWWLVRMAWRLIERRGGIGVLTYPGHVCSSLVYDAFRYAGVNLLPGHSSPLVTPDEVAASPLLKEVTIP